MIQFNLSFLNFNLSILKIKKNAKSCFEFKSASGDGTEERAVAEVIKFGGLVNGDSNTFARYIFTKSKTPQTTSLQTILRKWGVESEMY